MPEDKKQKIIHEKQPNSRNCFVCGLENETGLQLTFYEDPAGFVYSDVLVPARYQGYPDIVHGGILASMLDEIAGRAAMIDKPHHFMFTGKMEIRYRRPVPTGESLRLSGRIVQQKSRTAVAESRITLPDGSVGAEAEVTLVRIPDLDMNEEELEALGWQVYPE